MNKPFPMNSENRRSHRSAMDGNVDSTNGDVGFAAIELLRHGSPSLADQMEADDSILMDEENDGSFGHQSASHDVDISCMPLEDVLYELQREIIAIVSNLENDHSSPGHKKFIFSDQARNLFEMAILKLKLRHEGGMSDCYSSAQESDYLDTCNRVLLPLWPDGWMSSDELNQYIQDVCSNQLDEMLDGQDNMDPGGLYPNVSGDQIPSSISVSTYSGDVLASGVASYSASDFPQTSDGETAAAVCFVCNRSFGSAHLLKVHISHVHTPKELVCPECQSRHSTLNGLRFHVTSKHKGVSLRFMNDLVPPTPTVSVINIPTSVSGGQKPGATATAFISAATETFPSQLPRFSSSSIAFSQNGSSSSSMMNELGEVECTSCNSKFSSAGTLKAHISLMHTEKNVRCRYCPNLYATQRAMLQHIYLKHHKERNCQCPHCGLAFQTSGLEKIHRRYCSALSSKMDFSDISTPTSDGKGSHSGYKVDSLLERVQSGAIGSNSNVRSFKSAPSDGKYHCRDCGVGFESPSLVWVHRKNAHIGSTSIKGHGMYSTKRKYGGQVLSHDVFRQSAKDANNKKKTRVKCSACSAIFSNGYACYLHKKKVHGDNSIRRELNLAERTSETTTSTNASSATVSIATTPKLTPSTFTDVSAGQGRSLQGVASEKSNVQPGPGNQYQRISTSSSSSRDSSPFYKAIEGLSADGLVRRRYEFHCQCGMTFYNGFAFSRHRQRTGCSEGVRGVLIKECICGVCSEAFSSQELLNEHFFNVHGGNGNVSANIRPTSSSPATASKIVVSTVSDAPGISIVPPSSSAATASRSSSNSGSNSVGLVRNYPDQNYGSPATTTPAICSKRPLGSSPNLGLGKLPSRAEGSPSKSAASTSTNTLHQGVIRCQLCPYATLSMEALEEHCRFHQKPSTGPFGQSSTALNRCPYCTYAADSMSSYVRHTALHFSRVEDHLETKERSIIGNKSNETTKRPRLDCTYCARCFKSTSELMEHEFLHVSCLK